MAYLNLFIYLLLVCGGLMLAAPGVLTVRVMLAELSYLPDPAPGLLLFGLGLALVILTLFAGQRVLAARPPRWLLSAGIWVLFGGLLLIRESSEMRLPKQVAPAHSATQLEFERLSKALGVASRKAHRLPEAPRLLALDPLAPVSPWRSRGQRLRYQLVSERGIGPRLQSRQGDRPGTFYYVVAPGGGAAWLTALVLDNAPLGANDFLREADGRPRVQGLKVDRPLPHHHP